MVLCLLATAFYSCTAIFNSSESEGLGVFLAFSPQPGWGWSLDPQGLSHAERERLMILASGDVEHAMPWWVGAYVLGMLTAIVCWAILIVLVVRSFFAARATA